MSATNPTKETNKQIQELLGVKNKKAMEKAPPQTKKEVISEAMRFARALSLVNTGK